MINVSANFRNPTISKRNLDFSYVNMDNSSNKDDSIIMREGNKHSNKNNNNSLSPITSILNKYNCYNNKSNTGLMSSVIINRSTSQKQNLAKNHNQNNQNNQFNQLNYYNSNANYGTSNKNYISGNLTPVYSPILIAKKSIFTKIGIDVLNSNRVMMNFNKKNYLGEGSSLPGLNVLQNKNLKGIDNKKKFTIKQNNIVIKEPNTNNDFTNNNNNDFPNNFQNSNLNNSSIEKKNENLSSGLSISTLSVSLTKNINNSMTQVPPIKKRSKISNENLKLNFLNKVKGNDDNDNMDNCVNFLREMSNDDQSFINHLKLFQAYLDVEFSVDRFNGASAGKGYFNSTDKKPNLILSLKKYYSILRDEYSQSKISTNEFFIFEAINKLYLKSLKIQIIFFTVLMVCSTHIILDVSFKSQIKKLMTNLTSPIVNIFELFIYGQVLLNYNEIFVKELRSDFGEKYAKVYKNYKLTNKLAKLSDSIIVLTKNLESVTVGIKQISNELFKFSQLKPFHNVIFDLLKDNEKMTVSGLVNLTLNNILFCHLPLPLPLLLPLASKMKKRTDGELNFPFLPQFDYISGTYTLVLDLDETLVHFFYTQLAGGMFLVRPGALEFLKELSIMYEIVIFTAATKDYADDILDKLDPEGVYIKHRLYRNHTSSFGLHIIKDLSKLGRDLSKVIIIDNIPENFKLQINNGLMIKTWTDNIVDTQLQEICKILKNIYQLKISDVRTIIKRIREDLPILKSYQNVEVALYL